MAFPRDSTIAEGFIQEFYRNFINIIFYRNFINISVLNRLAVDFVVKDTGVFTGE